MDERCKFEESRKPDEKGNQKKIRCSMTVSNQLNRRNFRLLWITRHFESRRVTQVHFRSFLPLSGLLFPRRLRRTCRTFRELSNSSSTFLSRLSLARSSSRLLASRFQQKSEAGIVIGYRKAGRPWGAAQHNRREKAGLDGRASPLTLKIPHHSLIDRRKFCPIPLIATAVLICLAFDQQFW
jgi:hypothetical protein